MKPSLSIKKSLSIRKLLIIASVLTPILLTFSACSWFNSDGDLNSDSNIDSATSSKSTYSPLKTPKKIEGLYVGTCQELFDDMRKNYKPSSGKVASDDELYRAAAVILFSDERVQEANECCNKITEESLKEECKRQSPDILN